MKRKSLISVVILILLLLNLSIGVFAGEGDAGTTRPKVNVRTIYEESNTP